MDPEKAAYLLSGVGTNDQECREALDAAVEALEKQIPMEIGTTEYGADGKIIYPCGRCGWDVGKGDYCQFCGQKIRQV